MLILANMESYNAILIEQGVQSEKRISLLRKLVIQQIKLLSALNIDNLSGIR